MVEKKFLNFRKRILTYVVIFLSMATFAVLFALMQNLQRSPLFLKLSDLNYRVETRSTTIRVRASVGFESRGSGNKRSFSFPLHLPKDAVLKSFSVQYPLRSGKPVHENGFITWSGYVPQKGERASIQVIYEYQLVLGEVILPVKSLGTFVIKDTPITVNIFLDSKLREFSSNYDMISRIKGFKTTLTYSAELKRGTEDLFIKW
ncbi:hypothetical protein KAI78_07680 [bacterium]|nr:hypothetical protein [bacterium]